MARKKLTVRQDEGNAGDRGAMGRAGDVGAIGTHTRTDRESDYTGKESE